MYRAMQNIVTSNLISLIVITGMLFVIILILTSLRNIGGSL